MTARNRIDVDITFRDIHTGQPTLPLDCQREILRCKSLYKLIEGGYGSGKTMVACFDLAVACVKNKGYAGGILAPTESELFGNTLPKFLSMFPPLYPGQRQIDKIKPSELSPAIAKVDSKHGIIYWVWGGELHYYSTESTKRGIGPDFAHIMIDEAWKSKPDDFDRAFTRRRVNAPYRLGAFVGLPVPAPHTDALIDHPNCTHFSLSTVDNTHNDPDYVPDLLARYSEAEAQVYVHGNRVPLSGQVFPDYGMPNVIDYDWDPSRPVYGFVDFGYRKPYAGFGQNITPETVEARAALRDGEAVHREPFVLFDEIVRENTPTDKLAELILQLPKDMHLEAVVCDKAGSAHGQERGEQSIAILRNALRKRWPSIRVIRITDPALTSITAGIDAMRANIRSAGGERRMFVASALTRRDYGKGLAGVHQALLQSGYPKKDYGPSAEKPEKEGVLEHARDGARYGTMAFWRPKYTGAAVVSRPDSGRISSPIAVDVGGWRTFDA